MLVWSFVLSAQNVVSDNQSDLLSDISTDTSASKPSLLIIRTIYISGNKKTKPDIILRELPFRPGDQFLLQDIVKKFEEGREHLMNTALFHDAIIALKSLDGYNVDVIVEVKERWYLFPIPYFKPIDRNFNQWLVEQKASLKRVDYGVKLLYNNFTGYNDKLRVWLISGYTHQFSFEYDRLYFDKKLKWGADFKLATGKTKEVNYNTINNKQVFVKDSNNYLQNFLKVNAELTYRRAINTRHRFGIGYTTETISDTIRALNPFYFSSNRKQIRYFELYYDMTYFNEDYIPYPTKGYAAEILLNKKGFNNVMNLWQLTAKGSATWRVMPKTYLNLISFASVKVPFKQPFYNQDFLGYNDTYLQGYEYYVIDGVAGGYLKATLRREILNVRGNFLKKKRDEPIHIPIRVFAKLYGNVGYVHNPQGGDNFLNDKMLYSGGFGIDILTFYDFTLKLECTFNQLGEKGLFLHRTSYF